MKNRILLSAILLCSLLLWPATGGVKAQSAAGDWYGLADVQGFFLRIDLHITDTGSGLTGTFDSPDQGAMGIPLTSVSCAEYAFSFEFAPAGLQYEGFCDPGYTRIIGKFKQGGLNLTLNFYRQPVEMPANSTQKIMERYDKREVYITMRDGVRLFTSVYSPKNLDKPAPMLMSRTPYNIEGGGEASFNPFLGIYYRFVEENYIFVFQDVRGRFMSEGTFENVRPYIPNKQGNQTDEASDTWDTAEWLVNNVPNNNGNIGVFGVSYPGFYSTLAILANHPAIKAVSPQAPVTNWFLGDDWHHNGAFMLLDGFSFYTFFGEEHPAPSRRGTAAPFNWGVEDNYEFFMRHKTVKNLTETFFPSPESYLATIRNHPDYDDYWKSTDPRAHLRDIGPAVMTVGGHFDAEDCWGAWNTYKSIELQNPGAENILVMGPWAHGQWAGNEAKNLGNIYWGQNTNTLFHEQEVRFFNHHLKGETTEAFPEALIFMTGTNEWNTYDTWPPESAVEQVLYLHPGGKLSFEPPAVKEFFVEYVSDPMKPVPYTEDVHLQRTTSYMTDDQRFASRRPDVMVYQSDLLTEDVTLTGPLNADLWVSTSGTDADWVVKLIDVFPDQMPVPEGADIDVPLGGYQMLVRGEVMRGRYRNSFENPEPFRPGKITRVPFYLPDVSHTFKKGHRIMIQVQNSWFPLVDRNPQRFVNIYQCDESDFQKATMRVYSDKTRPSGLRVWRMN